MTYIQTITPNPNISDIAGDCLVYVRQAYKVLASGKYPTAISNWNGSSTKHQDQNFPAGCDLPIWFSLKTNADGHVAIHMSDGSVYSDSIPTGDDPYHAASIAALQQYYGSEGLTYLGWTEDVEDNKVITEAEEMLNDDSLYIAFRAILHRDPTVQEVETFTRDPNLALKSLWVNGGQELYNNETSGSNAVTKQEVITYINANLN